MSGGVDSSVAAHLLLEAGFEVVGVFMRHGREELTCSTDPGASRGIGELPWFDARVDHKQGCCSAADAEDARTVADRFGIPFYALNLHREFGKITSYFVEEYLTGRTPNPCVMCNTWLKFGKLFEYADQIGAEYVATGHYAQLIDSADSSISEMQTDRTGLPSSAESSPTRLLLRGHDRDKDQSYVLFGIPSARLRRMILPIGAYRKADVRSLATSLGLRVADKRDSQEICFVTSGHHADFVRQNKGERRTGGVIVTTEGTIVGEHDGIERFTIGQRKGLGVALGEPYFVVALEPESCRVVIGRHSELARQGLTAAQCNWLGTGVDESFRCEVQIRYNSRAQAATVTRLPGERMRVRFDEPCFGVAPGQAAVCYRDQQVLGGGWIESGESAVDGL